MADQTVHSYVHFIGIGGISMSALAHILLVKGIHVSGSDRGTSAIIDALRQDGAEITIGHSADNIKNPDLVVYTAAISAENEELSAARARGIPTMERADFLGELMKQYQYPVSVSGTHGKTTTTSMLACVLLEAEENPTILVGGELDAIGGNYKIGSEKHLIFEGCEYVDSFLKFHPYAALILNIEADHLDYFSGIEQIKHSFHRFMCKIPQEGFVVVNADDPNVMESLDGVCCRILSYGLSGRFIPKNIQFDTNGFGSFDLYDDASYLTHIRLSVAGLHNVFNATAVCVAALTLGIPLSHIERGLQRFRGTKRRLELRGAYRGARIYDDYAHHPTEIAATCKAIQQTRHRDTWVVFQPHTYSRTKALLHDFAHALSGFDHVIITDIYAAREKNTFGISAQQLAQLIPKALYMPTFSDIAVHLKENLQPDDLVIAMGAGTITELPQMLFDLG